MKDIEAISSQEIFKIHENLIEKNLGLSLEELWSTPLGKLTEHFKKHFDREFDYLGTQSLLNLIDIKTLIKIRRQNA